MSAATTTPPTTTRPLRIAVQRGVELDTTSVAAQRLDDTRHTVLPELPSGLPGQLACLDDRPVGQGELGAGVGQGAHDRRATTYVGPVADEDASGDPSFDHRRAEGAGVVVDEPFVHHGRALGEVRTEAHTVGVTDAYAGRDDVVGHPGELV